MKFIPVANKSALVQGMPVLKLMTDHYLNYRWPSLSTNKATTTLHVFKILECVGGRGISLSRYHSSRFILYWFYSVASHRFMMASSNGKNISTLLALCGGNSPITSEFPSQRPLTRSLDVFLNNRDPGDLRRHCAHNDVTVMFCDTNLHQIYLS